MDFYGSFCSVVFCSCQAEPDHNVLVLLRDLGCRQGVDGEGSRLLSTVLFLLPLGKAIQSSASEMLLSLSTSTPFIHACLVFLGNGDRKIGSFLCHLDYG